MAEAIRVIGLRELSRDFKRISKDLSDNLVNELEKAAQVVADDAEHLALTSIRNMPKSPEWAGMRIGVSRAQGIVYVVPAARRKSGGSRREKFGPMLVQRAMDPAIEKNQDKVVPKLEEMLDRLTSNNGF